MVFDIIKALIFGIVEGITEWLPISSTGHMILLNEVLRLSVSDAFWEMFLVVIQLGAILAVIVLFWARLWPFGGTKHTEQKKCIWALWGKVVLAVIPSAVLGFFFDDWMNAHLYNYITVAAALIFYGVLFIIIERGHAKTELSKENVSDIGLKTAVLIGLFQCLALIPGTSRSGSTILGAILLGVSRTSAAEFSFFLAIPTMAGASLLKTAKFIYAGVGITGAEWAILVAGCVSAFFVSVLVIRGLMAYVKRHTFSAFGVYRIILGALVFAYFVVRM